MLKQGMGGECSSPHSPHSLPCPFPAPKQAKPQTLNSRPQTRYGFNWSNVDVETGYGQRVQLYTSPQARHLVWSRPAARPTLVRVHPKVCTGHVLYVYKIAIARKYLVIITGISEQGMGSGCSCAPPPRLAASSPSSAGTNPYPASSRQIACFRSLICTGARRNLATCGTNQGKCRRRFGPNRTGWWFRCWTRTGSPCSPSAWRPSAPA